jgi:RNA:NAD 2'-phosphotransferase (TPT1/KptA family)
MANSKPVKRHVASLMEKLAQVMQPIVRKKKWVVLAAKTRRVQKKSLVVKRNKNLLKSSKTELFF